MDYEQIHSDQQLADFCRSLESASYIAFDTEFVSEDTYRPELCLVQVAAPDRLAVIDPLVIRDLAPFWRLISSGQHETLVHAGREEFLFCQRTVGKRPGRLFDLQIAAAFVGFEYPAGYGSLMSRLLGQRPHKGETRTDWRRRPLSRQQIEYALDDVRYLEPMRNKVCSRLERLGRAAWLADEMESWQRELEAADKRDRFWRTSGISGLSSRGLAIVREVWNWREQEAQRRNQPVRRILRDDLIVEIAKRAQADPKQIRMIRGMERGDLQRAMPQIGAAVERALKLSDQECPAISHRDWPPQITVLGQFLSSALSSICHAAEIAPSLVGTASDVRDLVAHLLGMKTGFDGPPSLGSGWRAEVVGQLINDLLTGKRSIRIHNPLSDDPLVFDLAPE